MPSTSAEARAQQPDLQPELGKPVQPPLVLDPRPITSDWAWFLFLVMGAASALRASLSLALSRPEEDSSWWIYSAALLLLSALSLVWRWKKRGRTIQAFQEGFALDWQTSRLGVLYEDISSYMVVEQEVAGGRERRVTFDSDTRGMRSFKIFSFAAGDETDATLTFIQDRLADEAERKIRSGGTLHDGDGNWYFGPDGLRPGPGPSIPLEHLAAVSRRAGSVQVWKTGEDLPVLRVPDTGSNALILLALLRRCLPAEQAAPVAGSSVPPVDGGLGRLRFEKNKGSETLPYTLLLLALVLALLGAPALMKGYWRGVWLLLIGVALGSYSIAKLRKALWVYEHGVIQRTLRPGRRELRFSEVQRIAVVRFSSALRLHSAQPGSHVDIPLDEDGEELRDMLAGRIAERLAQELEARGTVQWTPRVRLSSSGIHAQDATGRERLIPVARDLRITVDARFARLLSPQEEGPVLTLPLSEENVYPGLLLLQKRIAESPPLADPRPGANTASQAAGLGRLSFTRRPIVWSLFTGAGLLAIAFYLIRAQQADMGVAVLGAFLLMLGIRTYEGWSSCHERGIVQTTFPGRRRTLRFESLSALAQHESWLALASTEDSRSFAIGLDRRVGELRDRLALEMADRLEKQLEVLGEVPWIESVRLSRRAIRVEDPKVGEIALPLTPDLRFTLDPDWLRLYEPQSTAPVLSLAASEWSLYPGLLLLQKLIAESSAQR